MLALAACVPEPPVAAPASSGTRGPVPVRTPSPTPTATATLTPSPTTSVCPWKGTASYYSVEVDGEVNTDAAWYYPAPKEAAAQIKDRVAFWKGVQVSA